MEGPGESIRRNFPALGYTRDRLGGFFIERREPLEKGDGEVLVGAGANELWIEILRFGAVTEVEDTVTVSGDDARLAWVATAEKKSGEEKQKDRQAQAHLRTQQAATHVGKTVFCVLPRLDSAFVICA